MAKSLDNDLRKRMVETMQEADCCRAVAHQFLVAATTVSRLIMRVERTGSCARQDGRTPQADSRGAPRLGYGPSRGMPGDRLKGASAGVHPIFLG